MARIEPPHGLKPDAAPANDLRSYLRRKAALQSAAGAKPLRGKAPRRPKVSGTFGPVLKSIEAVLGQLRSCSAGDAPRAVLVTPASTKLDATDEAIQIARALSQRERTILVDLTRGAAAVSGQLGLPRAPGFADLAAGRASFEDVMQAEEETSLQIIPAGNPHVKSGDASIEAGRIVEALSQVYDRLVLHADRATLRQLEPALDGRLQLVVAIIAAGHTIKQEKASLAELTAFGCRVVPYEQSSGGQRPRRFGFFGRAPAI